MRRIGFQASQRVIGAFASVTRMIANGSPFLLAKDSDYRAIQIQKQA